MEWTNETCSLHPYDSRTGPEFMHEATDVLYYEGLDKNTDRVEYFGNCLTNYNNRCKNGGSCKSNCSKQGFYCACPENYHGDVCQFAQEDEPVLVQTIEGIPSVGCAGLSFDNEHFLIIGGFLSDVNGSNIETTSNVYKFNETTDQYEYDHVLDGVSKVQRVTPIWTLASNNSSSLPTSRFTALPHGRRTRWCMSTSTVRFKLIKPLKPTGPAIAPTCQQRRDSATCSFPTSGARPTTRTHPSTSGTVSSTSSTSCNFAENKSQILPNGVIHNTVRHQKFAANKNMADFIPRFE